MADDEDLYWFLDRETGAPTGMARVGELEEVAARITYEIARRADQPDIAVIEGMRAVGNDIPNDPAVHAMVLTLVLARFGDILAPLVAAGRAEGQDVDGRLRAILGLPEEARPPQGP